MRLLLTWSDRSVIRGPRSHHRDAPSPRDRGPIVRLLEQPESQDAYDAAWVLTTPLQQEATDRLVAEMRAFVPDVQPIVLDVPDPSDHARLFAALMPVVDRVSPEARVTVVLSAGTPQAQTIWVVLVQSGLLAAQMLQVVPPAFVPDPHPRALREVTLDIEGFPVMRALREEVQQLRADVVARGGMVGHSTALMRLIDRVTRVATAPVPVLIHGETGSGKELVARAIHDASGRREGPLLAINCGALSAGTLESELFGHERGAFTGAVGRRRGLFELADGGTLFLDEIGEADPAVQVRLLRVLETGVLRRVGGEREVRVDVRVVAATHRDLREMAGGGRFREDLYYRLKGAVLDVPPLRERAGDLRRLVQHFLGRAELQVTPAAWGALESYAWPGNVRELRAEVARWRVFCDHRVTLEDLSDEIRVVPSAARSVPDVGAPVRLRDAVRALERQLIDEALERTGHNLSRAARELGIDRNTLKRKLR
ncbi:MAG: sigma-54 interaction domain-containing protein [Sandaracinaceae bacterium]